MVNSIEKQIFKKIKKAKRGTLFFVESFLTVASAKSVNKALERLASKGDFVRVANGIYVLPKNDNIIGTVTPGIEEIVKAIARRDKARVVPTGSYALNRLGLSTQVPLKVVYLTDGAARKIKIGNTIITFRKTTPKNVAAVGEISRLVIQALRTIGKNKVTKEEIRIILELLKKEKQTKLEHDIRLAPAWIREIMKQAIINSRHE